VAKTRSLIADLPRGIGVRKTRNSSGTDYFRVELGKKFTGRSGSPITKNFRTLTAAREWIFGEAQKEKIKIQPLTLLHETSRDSSFSMSPREWGEAASAFQRCKESGVDLPSVVDAGLKVLRPSGGTRSFEQVSTMCQEAAAEEKKSFSHRQHMKIVAKRFGLEFGNESISNFTREVVEQWLSEEFDDQNTRRYYARYLHIFFAEACKRNWTKENVLKYIPRSSVPLGDISFLQASELKSLLLHAHKANDGPLTAGIAVKAFAGLRTSELLSLRWCDVGPEQIHVRAVNAKTRQARPVSVCSSLATFLKHYKGDPSSRVVPYSRRHWHFLLSSLAASAKVSLTHNCLRHSFGTYHYHLHKNEHLTASEMGNKPDTVIRWYRAPIVDPKQTKMFWGISLKTLKANPLRARKKDIP
jgi:integrase